MTDARMANQLRYPAVFEPAAARRCARAASAGLWLVYEGFGTPVLQEAKVLLDELRVCECIPTPPVRPSPRRFRRDDDRKIGQFAARLEFFHNLPRKPLPEPVDHAAFGRSVTS